MVSSRSMAGKKKPPKTETYEVGDRVKVNLHNGEVVDAVIRAVIDDEKFQVDFGKFETALLQKWQIVERIARNG